MSKLQIVPQEESKFIDSVKLQQEVTPKPQVQKKEGRIKRIVSHLMGPDGFKAVVMNTLEHQIKPSVQNLAGSCIRMVFEGIQRTIFDLIFGIGEGERMMRNSGAAYGGFGFSGTGFRFNGATNPFHKGIGGTGINSQWDRSLTDSQRTQARDDLYRRNARQPLASYFDSFEQAMDLLNRLGSHAATLGYITVANYHELCGYDTSERERDFGWYLEDIQNLAAVENDSRLGYYVSLPPTTLLRK